MNATKRGLTVAILVMMLLFSAFFLFACSALYGEDSGDPLHLAEYPLTEEELDRYVLKSDDSMEEQTPAADTTQTDDAATPGDGTSDGGALTDDAPTDTSAQNVTDDGTNDGGKNTDDSDQNGQDDGEDASPDAGTQNTGEGGTDSEGEEQQNGEEQQPQSVPLPAASAAREWLSALPGRVAALEVTTITEDSEVYKFDLLSLTASEAESVRSALLTCTVKFDRENTDGSRSLHVQKQIGDKMFTFMVSLTVDGNYYKAVFSVSGFALED